jgi:hypothetical protein
MWTTGYRPYGRGLEDLEQLALVVLAMVSDTPEPNTLTRKRARDKDCLAGADDPLTVVREPRYSRDFRGRGRGPGASCPVTQTPELPGGVRDSHARRNSA